MDIGTKLDLGRHVELDAPFPFAPSLSTATLQRPHKPSPDTHLRTICQQQLKQHQRSTRAMEPDSAAPLARSGPLVPSRLARRSSRSGSSAQDATGHPTARQTARRRYVKAVETWISGPACLEELLAGRWSQAEEEGMSSPLHERVWGGT